MTSSKQPAGPEPEPAPPAAPAPPVPFRGGLSVLGGSVPLFPIKHRIVHSVWTFNWLLPSNRAGLESNARWSLVGGSFQQKGWEQSRCPVVEGPIAYIPQMWVFIAESS